MSPSVRGLARSAGCPASTARQLAGLECRVDLVARGRYPYQTLLRQWSRADDSAVAEALRAIGTTELSRRPVDQLSGGQRQRAWVAMMLAQERPLILLEGPTTFLDIAHQMELLQLFRRLNRERRTIVAVLHDLNQAARYATHLIAMKDGAIVASGEPRDVITSELVEDVFGLRNVLIDDPVTGGPLIVPLDGDVPAAQSAPR